MSYPHIGVCGRDCNENQGRNRCGRCYEPLEELAEVNMEEDQSQGLTLGEKLYCYGLIVIGCVAFGSIVAWIVENVRAAI